MRRCVVLCGALGILIALGGTPAAAEEDEAVIREVLQILKERGLVDESRYNQLIMKNKAYEERQTGLLGRIEWSGDLRGRVENFWFDRDDLGGDAGNRTRLRYRLRLGGVATINDWLKAGFRIASGELDHLDRGDHRSTNRTLGKDDDFGLDSIFIDRAYLEMRPPAGFLPEAQGVTARFGKVANPFLWDHGKDYMLWDNDINPEGVSLQWRGDLNEVVGLYLNTGYFVIDENSGSKDPHVIGVQGGVTLRPGSHLELGARLSGYAFRSLNSGFFARAAASGSTVDLADDSIEAGELAAYLRWDGIVDWPVLVYGHYAHNFSAEDALASGEDAGWGVGVEVGDKRRWLKLGAGYYQIEADFWPGQYVDSDIFDGFTNRKAWTFYGSREILPRTDLNVTLFLSEDLETRLPGFAVSTRNAERVRLQTDIVVKF